MNKRGIFQFKGGHTEAAVGNFVNQNGGGKHVVKHLDVNLETGIYSGDVVIELNNGKKLSKGKEKTSFFPKNWTENQILDVVEEVAQNIIGMHPKFRNGYVGKTKSGIYIVMFYDEISVSDKTVKQINSFFPLTEKISVE